MLSQNNTTNNTSKQLYQPHVLPDKDAISCSVEAEEDLGIPRDFSGEELRDFDVGRDAILSP